MTTATAIQTILVVDDDDAASTKVADILNADGYRVARVPNGREALDYLSNCPAPDLIVLDMASLDSWRLLTKYVKENASIPILMTSCSPRATGQWAVAAGAAGVLRKPVDGQELLNRVRGYLG